MILLIDNYDSFTYNLYHYVMELGYEVLVKRNDEVTVDEIETQIQPQAIILSPGPCDPDDAGICLELIKALAGKFPIFGVCLGHQSIAQAFGGTIIRADTPMHGKVSPIMHQQQGVFSGLPSPFNVTRYHSLIVDKESLPDCFTVTSETDDGVIMGIEHKEYLLQGVQFHPESIVTEHGHAMLKNFLDKV